MRENPYLKNEQRFRPLLMRGSVGNLLLAMPTEENHLAIQNEATFSKYNYVLPQINKTSRLDILDRLFSMVRSPTISSDGQSPWILPGWDESLEQMELCATECSQGMFEEVMGFNPSTFKTDSRIGAFKAKDRPVECVTWFDAISFCNKLSKSFGYVPYYAIKEASFNEDGSMISAEVSILGGCGFRLPTDREWKIFAIMGERSILIHWKSFYSPPSPKSETTSVQSDKPDSIGLYHMFGNVSEWVYPTSLSLDGRFEYVYQRSGGLQAPTMGGSYATDGDYILQSIIPQHGRFRDYPIPDIYVANMVVGLSVPIEKSETKQDSLGFRFARTLE